LGTLKYLTFLLSLKMEFNKSQGIIIGTITSAMLGLPDINKVFTEEVINLVMTNPNPTIILIVSVLKILLVIASIAWAIQLYKNIELTSRTKSQRQFDKYMTKLVITGIITFFLMLFIKARFGI